MSEKKNDPLNPKVRKIRFCRRSPEGESVLDFCFGRGFRTYNYTLVEGSVYDLPEDVISHINNIKKVRAQSNVNTGEHRIVEEYYYYCEPVVQ